jgi:hypothetical protein
MSQDDLAFGNGDRLHGIHPASFDFEVSGHVVFPEFLSARSDLVLTVGLAAEIQRVAAAIAVLLDQRAVCNALLERAVACADGATLGLPNQDRRCWSEHLPERGLHSLARPLVVLRARERMRVDRERDARVRVPEQPGDVADARPLRDQQRRGDVAEVVPWVHDQPGRDRGLVRGLLCGESRGRASVGRLAELFEIACEAGLVDPQAGGGTDRRRSAGVRIPFVRASYGVHADA